MIRCVSTWPSPHLLPSAERVYVSCLETEVVTRYLEKAPQRLPALFEYLILQNAVSWPPGVYHCHVSHHLALSQLRIKRIEE